MIRVLCLIGGLTGAAGLSQFPEFSQQYMQRLGGQVDELTRQVVDFDQTALADGMGREEMLQAMAETPLVASQEPMWRRTFARHARLSENLMILRDASPMERLMMPHRMADTATVQAVWDDFSPAMPLSVAGAAAAGTGFLGGWMAFAALLGAFALPFRKKASQPMQQKRKPPSIKSDPPLTRPTLVAGTQGNRPRLAGVQR
ncbi:DUF2937 family protein [Roseobacter sp. CCS2]|uniref:DUF2937 family protein n=1 Tax=Roseobacter sp. CCS2 TaxID=391593 RepID=UPI0000F3E56B|nr:DUF2937 family protein [Roseobacter sp. CCS2]EBA12564.1 hypothetical protein RCCS2_14744 [Roseobacter sp. CCS2]